MMGNFLQNFVGKHITTPNVDHHVTPRLMTQSNVFSRNFISWLFAAIASTTLYFTEYNYWQIHLVFWISSFGNEVHNWNHLLESELNWVQKFMKESSLVQQKINHSRHHKPPYLKNYCVMIDFNNAWMERINFWRRLEWFISLFGIHPQRENRRDFK